jgi:hypothetical protein
MLLFCEDVVSEDVADDEPGEGADDDEADQEGGHREVAGRPG